MSRLASSIDRLRLAVERCLYRQGLWWPLLAVTVLLLVALAAIAIPGRQAELAARQETLSELQARATYRPSRSLRSRARPGSNCTRYHTLPSWRGAVSAQSSGTRNPIAPVAVSSASGMSGDNAS